MEIKLNEKKSNHSDSKLAIKYNLPVKEDLEQNDFDKIEAKGCVISGNIGCGKTNLAKRIYLEFNRRIFEEENPKEDLKLRVFDVVGAWRNIERDVKIVDKNDEFIDLDTINIFILRFKTTEERLDVMERIVSYEYEAQQELYDNLKRRETLKKRFIYIIEEANTIFTTFTINKGFWLDFVAIARNYKTVGIYIMQRLSDSSTKVIERIPNFIFGKTKGQNDKRKIKAMLSSKEERNDFENLKENDFLCVIGNEAFILARSKEEAERVEEWIVE